MEHRSSKTPASLVALDADSNFEVFPLVSRCLREESADQLELYGKIAQSVLRKLRNPLNKAKDNLEASRFLRAINQLTTQFKQTQTIIGVVGNTGGDARYRAEIEFITIDDWKKELGYLYEDLLDSRGDVVKESLDEDTESGTKEALNRTTVDVLANAPDVRAVLGQIQTIANAAADTFRANITKYIDSDEKEGQERLRGEEKRMEFWPLIKVVRIFTRSEVLSMGTTLVDLPGAHDSNAARAAVASTYMQKCDAVWIVAAIQRAVDDKTAQNLLGQSFKLQLKFDCKYSQISFICSKTDDILVLEALKLKSLRREQEVIDCQNELEQVRSESAKNTSTYEALSKRGKELGAKEDELQGQISHWQELAINLDKGNASSAPTTVPQKRTYSARQAASRKRMTYDIDELPSDSEDDNKEAIKSENTANEPEQKPLTKEIIHEELDRLRNEIAQVSEDHDNIDTEIKPVGRLFRSQKKRLPVLETQLKSLCIQGRNTYAIEALRHDFAAGCKEMDQDKVMRQNGDLFVSGTDNRDYNEEAASLPVFWVSSRAYQKTKGRLEGEDPVQGFPTLEHTGIPQLQIFAKRLTEPGRVKNAQNFLEDFTHIINSLNLWSKDHSAEVQLSDCEKQDQNLIRAAELTVAGCRGTLTNHLYTMFDKSVKHAAETALQTTGRWFASTNDGGMFWNTFRATCRREGAHSGRRGFRDLNEELVQPLRKMLASDWERVFDRRIPQVLSKFPVISKALLEKFHAGVKIRIQAKASSSTINMLMVQVRGKDCFKRMRDIMLDHVTTHQHSMFRRATDSVREKLDKLCEELERDLLTKIDLVIAELTSEYRHVIIEKNLVKVSQVARNEIPAILSETDVLFQAPFIDAKAAPSIKTEVV
ncbi:hypothetical protein BKA67DRAFT_658330 [Truncatella angustata]|uniref:DUF7605 domain-containing protein n=1 Tax=Truncatella angustata TaxID=152316 RepID=A0A9P8UKS6_9PEZI|nr:uncharacterized protein BKA67DRAFT_658330 [Truncatella angustata]KAH6653996.1 hypothetical protein BKA67DRAFT_658330 [Truncatella angustata]